VTWPRRSTDRLVKLASGEALGHCSILRQETRRSRPACGTAHCDSLVPALPEPTPVPLAGRGSREAVLHASPQSPISLFPVRPDIGADHAAPRADHARAELAHQEVARVLVDVEDHLVPAAVHEMSSDRTPFWRMFARSIGSNSYLRSRLSTGHQSVSRARIIAGLSGFLIFSQSRDGPDR
jgi:hypothetical protein